MVFATDGTPGGRNYKKQIIGGRRQGTSEPFVGGRELFKLQSSATRCSAGPSSNGRTADFGSVNGGSNPPGPIELTKSCFSLLLQSDRVPLLRVTLDSFGYGATRRPTSAP